jgi:hypothetical protein
MSQCIRPWEHGFESTEVFEAQCVGKLENLAELPTVGGDHDAHDSHGHECIPSAGYSWCAKMQKCIRPWEQGLATPEAFQQHCGVGRFGGNADEHGCVASAGYSWCTEMKQCIRPWEHGFKSTEAFQAQCVGKLQDPVEMSTVGGDRDAHGCITSAGYSWCAKAQKCIQHWEQGLATPESFQQHCGVDRFGGDADQHG